MFSFQTLVCLHDIPIVRSSTNALQDLYTKAKDKSVSIRFSCSLIETAVDHTLKIASTIANPIVKPLHESARVFDNFAAESLRRLEGKYPIISIRAEQIVGMLNEKTHSLRHVLHSVNDTTTSTFQYGRAIASNVTMATLHAITNLADTVYTFCETHISGKTIPVNRFDFDRRTTLLWRRVTSMINLQAEYMFHFVGFLLIWSRLLIVSCLLKGKQKADETLSRIPRKPFLSIFLLRMLFLLGTFLECIVVLIRPESRDEATERPQSKKEKHQKYFTNRQTLKPGEFTIGHQDILSNKNNVVANSCEKDEKQQAKDCSSCLTTNSRYKSMSASPEFVPIGDANEFCRKLKATGFEPLYSRLPVDIFLATDKNESETNDHQTSCEMPIDDELGNDSYTDDEDTSSS